MYRYPRILWRFSSLYILTNSAQQIIKTNNASNTSSSHFLQHRPPLALPVIANNSPKEQAPGKRTCGEEIAGCIM